jgi:hypothetical protein
MPLVLSGSTGIVEGNIADSAITTNKIAASNITAAKLASGAAKTNYGAITTSDMPAGTVLQIVSAIKTDTQSSSSSGDVAINGLSVSITPRSTSSKIFITYSINYDSTRGNSGGGFRIYRNGSHWTSASGQAAGNRYTVTGDFGANTNADQSGMHRSFSVLDSPSTTSQLTYAMYINQDSGFTTHINRARTDGNEGDDGRFASSITVMEIAG